MIAVIDSRMPQAASRTLERLGFTLCPLPPFPLLDTPVSAHPDMLLFFGARQIYCAKDYGKLAMHPLTLLSRHTHRAVVEVQAPLGKSYPYDIPLNAAPIGERLICYPKHTASEILAEYPESIIPVRQGYSKCATLPIGKRALITEDPSIASVAQTRGLEVLRVSQNAVSLPGYPTGFLGGCASFSPYCDYDSILFCGDLDSHPDANDIRAFCAQHHKKIMSLGDFSLTDVGTIFLL